MSAAYPLSNLQSTPADPSPTLVNGSAARTNDTTMAQGGRGPTLVSTPASMASRWDGVVRPYSSEDVDKLRGSVRIDYTLARLGAQRLWDLLHAEDYVCALGALTGNQAMQQVRAGLKAIYLSGWQVAADANVAGEMYPDQSLYPANSVPQVVRRINNTLLRADQIQCAEGTGDVDFLQPIVADAEAGFGG